MIASKSSKQRLDSESPQDSRGEPWPTGRTMTRGEVAVWAGVGSETVRYYEQRNLIPEPPRSAAGYRQYDISYVDRILFIKRSQELGFSLAEIKELLSLKVDPSVDCGAVKRRAQAKVRDVENKIADLQRMGAVLADLANACSGQGSTSECPILKALERRSQRSPLARAVSLPGSTG